MDERYIALAVPVFFCAMAAEYAHARLVRGVERYRVHDTLSSLACGVGQQVLSLGLSAAAVALYAQVYARARLFTWDERSPLVWLAALLLLDLCYYAVHRANHRVNLLWAGHAVHHQSEEYNLSTALRQSWLEPVLAIWFYLPLALLGFSPELFVAALTADTLYQFWIHTRAVRSLGPLEWVLNTPSHHRVHHGVDPAYIDKNYGGVLIVWDRLFGTFEPEAREPYYGTVKPLARFSAFYANAFEWLRIASLARAAGTLGEKLYAPFAPPEWRPAALGGPGAVPAVDPGTYARFDVAVPRAVDAYAVAQFLVTTAVGTALLWSHAQLPRALVAALVAWVLLGLGAVGALCEGRARAARAYELLRWLAAPALGFLVVAHAGQGMSPVRAALALGVVALAHTALALRLTAGLRGAPLAVPTPRAPRAGA